MHPFWTNIKPTNKGILILLVFLVLIPLVIDVVISASFSNVPLHLYYFIRKLRYAYLISFSLLILYWIIFYFIQRATKGKFR
jgi:hypothetical protein